MIITKRSYKKPILIVVACLVLSGLIFTTAFAVYRNNSSQSSNAKTESTSSDNKASEQDEASTKVEDTNPAEDTSTNDVSTGNTTPSVTPSTNTTKNSTQPTYTAPATSTPQQANQTPVATCNESMKASYTNLYNSRIAAENTRWSNQVNGFANYASGNGMSFSGYVQEQTAIARPTHDANIASIESQYQSNLASINCS